MSDVDREPLVYRSSSFRAASIGAGLFLAAIGIAVAAFGASAEPPSGTRFLVIDAVVTVVFAGWMFLGARVAVVIGGGEVQVRTKTRNGRFAAADVASFECRPGTAAGVPVGSSYLHLVLTKDAEPSPGVKDGVLNTWSPSPGPADRARKLVELNNRLAREKHAVEAQP